MTSVASTPTAAPAAGTSPSAARFAFANAPAGPLVGSARYYRMGPFVVAALAGLASVALTLPPQRPDWTIAAIVGTVAIAIGAGLLPWKRWPAGLQAVPALAYLAVVAVLRHGEGGADSGYAPLTLLPVVWLALYGTRLQLTLAIVGCALVFAIPIALAGPPEYPISEWRRGLLFVGTASIVGYVVQQLVEALRARDSELTALASELRRSNRELEEFASVAAHDLQEPLRKIQAFGDRLEARSTEALDGEARDYLDRMRPPRRACRR